MKYRVLDLIRGIEVRYPDESGDEPMDSYSLQEAKSLLVLKVTDAIESGRSINLAIIDTDHRVIEHVAVNVFS